MSLIRKLFRISTYRKPEFIYRPLQFLRRLRWKSLAGSGQQLARTAWGLNVLVEPSDRIGEAVLKTGSYDTAAVEVMFRLIEPGETNLDIGANFGLMTGVMAIAAGPDGTVHAFEPHPDLRTRLNNHLAEWNESTKMAKVFVHPTAVSSSKGTSVLYEPSEFDANKGTASLEQEGNSNGKGIHVETVRLDEALPAELRVGVLKIDIEGHEKAALEGAAAFLKSGQIRDIIYEDHEQYPSGVSELLELHGYEIFLIQRGFLRPRVLSARTPPVELPNYLATLDSERLERLLGPRGYCTLRKL